MPAPILVFAAFAALSPDPASPPLNAATAAPFALPIGSASFGDESGDGDRLMGAAFHIGLGNGANACYVNALMRHPGLAGEVRYTLRPPPGDGYFLTTVEGSGSIGDEVPECIRGVLHDFYHYASHPSFDRLEGTLRFRPRTIPAPPLPTEKEMAQRVEARYADQALVRVLEIEWLDGPYRFETDGHEARYRSAYRAQLEFVEDGFETTCRHYTAFKVFSSAPYQSRAAGTSCSSTPRHAGEHVRDSGGVLYRLVYYPEVASAWEYRGD